jgi:hypothetical protein
MDCKSEGMVKTNLIRRYAGFLSMVLIAAMAMTPGISSAQKGKARDLHMCSLLTASDVTPIVGAGQMAQETKGGLSCMWGDPGTDPNKPRLLIQAPAFSATSEMSFKANRSQAFDDKTSQAKNEPELGKNAFSALMDDGAGIIILKKEALLNIHLMTGKRGVPENVDAIRKVAVKVAESF